MLKVDEIYFQYYQRFVIIRKYMYFYRMCIGAKKGEGGGQCFHLYKQRFISHGRLHN